MADELVRVEIGDGSEGSPSGVATLHLQRPPMNALNTELQEQCGPPPTGSDPSLPSGPS